MRQNPDELPTLPVTTTTKEIWPTFSISIEERRAISKGLVPPAATNLYSAPKAASPVAPKSRAPSPPKSREGAIRTYAPKEPPRVPSSAIPPAFTSSAPTVPPRVPRTEPPHPIVPYNRSSEFLAKLSFIAAWLTVVLFLVGAIPAVVCGSLALASGKTSRKARTQAGWGIAIAVVITIVQFVIIGIVVTLQHP